jgi:hypothetical protein
MDLAAAVEFDEQTAKENVRRARPGAAVFELSAKTGAGVQHWLDYLMARLHEKHRELANTTNTKENGTLIGANLH